MTLESRGKCDFCQRKGIGKLIENCLCADGVKGSLALVELSDAKPHDSCISNNPWIDAFACCPPPPHSLWQQRTAQQRREARLSSVKLFVHTIPKSKLYALFFFAGDFQGTGLISVSASSSFVGKIRKSILYAFQFLLCRSTLSFLEY